MKRLNTPNEGAVLDAAARALSDLGVPATARVSGSKAAAVVVVAPEGRALRYRVDVRRRITPAVLGAVSLAFSDGAEDRLLITDYATPPVAEALRQRGIQFIDSAGNAFLKRRGLLVVVTGRTPRIVLSAKSPRVFRPSGLKVLFVLLSAPDMIAAPQRTIAHAADVALGSVGQVIEGLRELGVVAEIRGTRRLVNRDRLIDPWAEAYARRFEASLLLGRFSAPASAWWRHADVGKHGAQWGGETAAAILQQHLVPEHSVVYAGSLPLPVIARHRLKADPSGSVIFRRRFWNAVPSPRHDVVPPLLIYADLLTTGDARSVEAAKQIRDAYLV